MNIIGVNDIIPIKELEQVVADNYGNGYNRYANYLKNRIDEIKQINDNPDLELIREEYFKDYINGSAATMTDGLMYCIPDHLVKYVSIRVEQMIMDLWNKHNMIYIRNDEDTPFHYYYKRVS